MDGGNEGVEEGEEEADEKVCALCPLGKKTEEG